jgi:tripartite-type tricarboxylate transporter receptor subunit TctC
MKRMMLAFAAAMLACGSAAAQDVNFAGKTITMIIGYAPGGGTDTSGRLIAQFLAKYLPGSPNVVVENRPGADGVTAMNFFYQQVKPDGFTLTMASSTQGDPVVYKQPQVKYDPTRLEIIGGIGRGGSTVVIRKDAEPRLYDKSKPPGTNDLFVALERGEIDMTASSNLFQVQKLLETGKVKVLTQTGILENGKFSGRSEFGDVPVFPNQVEAKAKDPVQEQGYQYWFALVMLDKWLALPPGTPKNVVETYRGAFAKMAKDPEFLEKGKKMSQDFEAQTGEDVQKLIVTLGKTSPEAFDYIRAMMKRQGIGD